MKSKKQMKIQKVLFVLSVLFMLLFSLTFLFMRPANTVLINSGDQTFLNIVGVSFWSTFALSVITTILLNVRRRKCLKATGKLKKERPGIIRFFSNLPAKIADIIMVISLIALVIVMMFFSENYIIYVLLSVTLFSFLMHCVLNGENYRYIITLGKEENGTC